MGALECQPQLQVFLWNQRKTSLGLNSYSSCHFVQSCFLFSSMHISPKSTSLKSTLTSSFHSGVCFPGNPTCGLVSLWKWLPSSHLLSPARIMEELFHCGDCNFWFYTLSFDPFLIVSITLVRLPILYYCSFKYL